MINFQNTIKKKDQSLDGPIRKQKCFIFKFQPYFLTHTIYKITPEQASKLIKATYECYSMLLRTADYVINTKPELMEFIQIPENLRPIIQKQWNKRDQSNMDLFGRFDFLINSKGDAKLIEFNGDTPLLMIESSIGQQQFFEHLQDPYYDQFNFLKDAIQKAFLNFRNHANTKNLFLTGHFQELEEKMTMTFLQLITKPFYNSQIADLEKVKFENGTLNYEGQDVSFLWKLYPYEWLTDEIPDLFEKFGDKLVNNEILMLEPAWKLVLSNKGLLPIMNLLYPESKYLIKSTFDLDQLKEQVKQGPYVSKRFYGREGNSVLYSTDFENMGEFQKYSYEPAYLNEDKKEAVFVGDPIFQDFQCSPTYQGRSITVGSWVVQGVPACLCIREDIKGKTDSSSSFVTHLVEGIPYEHRFVVTQQEAAIRERIYGKGHLERMLQGQKYRFSEFVVSDPERDPNLEQNMTQMVQKGQEDRQRFHSFFPLLNTGAARSAKGGSRRTSKIIRTIGKQFRSKVGG